MTQHIPEPIHQDRVWSDDRWTARVIKNEDDDVSPAYKLNADSARAWAQSGFQRPDPSTG